MELRGRRKKKTGGGQRRQVNPEAEEAGVVVAQPSPTKRLPASFLTRPVVHPREFTGSDETWGEYLSYFNSVARLNNWTPEVKALFLPVCLKGESYKIYNSLPEHVRLDFEQTAAGIETYFNPPELRDLRKDIFRRRKQHAAETLSQFANDLRGLYERAQPLVPDGPLKEEALVDKFVEGIRDRRVRLQTSLTRPRLLTTALGRALEVETAFAMHGGIPSPLVERPRVPLEATVVQGEDDDGFSGNSVAAAGDRQGLQVWRSSVDNQLGEQRAQLADMAQTLTSLDVRLRNGVPRPRSGGQRDITCWTCGRRGHTRAQCGKKGGKLRSTRAVDQPLVGPPVVPSSSDGAAAQNYIEIQVNGKSAVALVDSGASFSLVSVDYARCMGLHIEKGTFRRLAAANGNSIQTHGVVQWP